MKWIEILIRWCCGKLCILSNWLISFCVVFIFCEKIYIKFKWEKLKSVVLLTELQYSWLLIRAVWFWPITNSSVWNFLTISFSKRKYVQYHFPKCSQCVQCVFWKASKEHRTEYYRLFKCFCLLFVEKGEWINRQLLLSKL